jgi:predicted DNA-binding protein
LSAGLGQRVAPDLLIEDLINKSVFLPIIQRGFEWEGERIEKFFDSLVKGIPLGLILLYQHDTSFFPTLGRKFFEKFDESTQKDQYKYELTIENGKFLVIDGQQRLQALYLAIKGSFYGQVLYHNIRWARTEDVHEVSFRFEKDVGPLFEEEGKLYIKLQTLYEIAKQHIRDRSGSRPERLKGFQSTLLKKGIAKITEEGVDELMEYVENTATNVFFVPEFFARSMIVQVMRPTDIPGKNKLMSLVETFVRFNSGGLRLEKMDLMFSILKARGWTEVEDRINDLSSRTGISKDLLIKALIMLNGMSARTDIYMAADRIDTLKTTYGEFEQLIQSLYDRLFQITELPERILKKFNFLIPAIYYLWRRPKEVKTTPVRGGLTEYILIIAYNSGLRSDSYLDSLIKIVKDHVDQNEPDFPIQIVKDRLKELGVQEYLDGSSLSRDPILTFSLIQRNNWRPLNQYNRLHIDHIFPQSRYSELPQDQWTYVFSIWNEYVVFQGDNISKGDTLPVDYFSGSRESFLGFYILPKEKNLLKKENFLTLIEWRQQQICERFKTTLGIEVQAH